MFIKYLAPSPFWFTQLSQMFHFVGQWAFSNTDLALTCGLESRFGSMFWCGHKGMWRETGEGEVEKRGRQGNQHLSSPFVLLSSPHPSPAIVSIPNLRRSPQVYTSKSVLEKAHPRAMGGVCMGQRNKGRVTVTLAKPKCHFQLNQSLRRLSLRRMGSTKET